MIGGEFSSIAKPRKATTISVVIPCFNSSIFITETLDSLFHQTIDGFEIIIVDDGSSDNSASLVRKTINIHSQRNMVLLEQENKGVAAARNEGISIARGQYIIPLDADDLIAQDMLEKCKAILDENSDIDIVYTDRRDFGDYDCDWQSGHFELSRLKYFNQLSYCAIYNKTVWEKVGGYQENVSGFDDWDFWIKAAAYGFNAHHIALPLFLHRRTRSSQLWTLLNNYESLFSKVILNNSSVYSQSERDSAESYLQTGATSALLRTAKLLFTKRYYSGYG